MDLMIGRVLGQPEIVGRLGVGGMGKEKFDVLADWHCYVSHPAPSGC